MLKTKINSKVGDFMIYLAVSPRGESTLTAAWKRTENTNQ